MLKSIGAFLADFFGITQLRDSYRAMGNPRLATLTLLGTFTWIGVWAWLMITVEWPGTCEHGGRGLVRLFSELRCSPDLLAGGPKEIGLFVMTWTVPAIVAAACLWRLVYEVRKRRR